MLGVVFGVGSVVAMLAVGEGASQEALRQIEKLGSNNIILTSVKPIEEQSSSTQRSFLSIYGLTYLNHRQITESFEDVKSIAPAKIIRKEARKDTRSMELRVVGTTEEWFNLVPREILAGRVLTQEDNYKRSSVAVITEYAARKLLATTNTVGQTIKVGGDYFKVVGIVKSEAGETGNIQVPDERTDVYIPLNTTKSYFGDVFTKRTSGNFIREQVELHQIIAQVNNTDNVEATAAGIERMLAETHKNEDYKISVPLALLKQAEASKRIFNIVLGSIASISLLVGGIGIMNIMLASVTERTREIGIRRAIGARRGQIITQFLIETVVLSTLGGFVGLGMGMLIPQAITWFAEMPTVITINSILLPLIISIAIGIVFGLYPAANAAKVDPIIALRHE
jgi:putative ABC transport system permease protein